MADSLSSGPADPAAAKSVQSYIDEVPRWADGTPLGAAPMTAMQWRIWTLAAAGKFFEGFVVFITGVALSLISRQFHIRAADNGIIGGATLFGILVGAVGLGGLSDHLGRKFMFVFEMVVFVVFLTLLVLCNSSAWLIICLFGLGLALGCDYPTAHMIISENIPSTGRGRLVLAAFGFQAVGALAGTAIGYAVLSSAHDLAAWRWMYASAIVPALAVLIARFYVTESAQWLSARGELEQAEQAARQLLERKPPYPRTVRLALPAPSDRRGAVHKPSFIALFKKHNLRATILAAVPWFLQDLATYGIGIFTPTMLAAAIGASMHNVHGLSDLIHNDIVAAKGAALVNVLLIIGVACSALLADKVGRIALEVGGFIGCAIGLLLASFSASWGGAPMLFAGIMLFNFMTNLGPNAQTYLLAGEVFPTQIRGKGAGFAAAFAKGGATASAVGFPFLLTHIGTAAVLDILVATSLLGSVVSWVFRIETTGLNLETI